MEYKFTTKSPQETERVGEAICRFFMDNGKSGALVALRGEMGVGKTAFVRGFCRLLGIRSVKSPTYTVVNAYAGERCRVYHFDTYRIEGEERLLPYRMVGARRGVFTARALYAFHPSHGRRLRTRNHLYPSYGRQGGKR